MNIGLIIVLGLILLVAGAIIAHFAPGIISEAFFWVAVIGAVTFVIGVILLVISLISPGTIARS